MYHNESYILSLKTPHHITVSIYLLTMFLVLITVICTSFYYHPMITAEGVVIKQNEQLLVSIYLENSNLFYKSALFYKKEIVSYQLISISKPYSINNKAYVEVIVDINDLDYLLVENNVVVFNLYQDKTNFISEFTDFIKKGLVQW